MWPSNKGRKVASVSVWTPECSPAWNLAYAGTRLALASGSQSPFFTPIAITLPYLTLPYRNHHRQRHDLSPNICLPSRHATQIQYLPLPDYQTAHSTHCRAFMLFLIICLVRIRASSMVIRPVARPPSVSVATSRG